MQARYENGRARLREAVRFIPNLAKLAMRLARDPRVPLRCRLAMLILGGYLLSPIDLIPDFIPVLGMVNDIVFASLTLRWVARRFHLKSCANTGTALRTSPNCSTIHNPACAAS